MEQIQCFLQLISYHADIKLDSSGYIESHWLWCYSSPESTKKGGDRAKLQVSDNFFHKKNLVVWRSTMTSSNITMIFSKQPSKIWEGNTKYSVSIRTVIITMQCSFFWTITKYSVSIFKIHFYGCIDIEINVMLIFFITF